MTRKRKNDPKGTEEKRHPSALTEAILGHVEAQPEPERFAPDPPEEADAWKNTPTRNSRLMPTAGSVPDLVSANPGSGIVAQPIKDDTTRPTTTAELVRAVDEGRITPSGALDAMTHRGKKK